MSSYDAIIVGGGVVGASTAYHLVRAGAKTLLIDRRDPGRATDAGAGILAPAPQTDPPDPIERFEARAAAYYPVLIDQLRNDGAGATGYKVCGSLSVAVDQDEVAHLEQIRSGLRLWRAATHPIPAGTSPQSGAWKPSCLLPRQATPVRLVQMRRHGGVPRR